MAWPYDKKGMTKRFRPWDPKQKWLLPPEITEFIPEGHPAHFVRDLKACIERMDFAAVTGFQKPDFRTISLFRKRHLTALGGLFQQVLVLCRQAGLVALGHVALDGTKVIAEWQMVCTGHNLLKLARASG